MKAANSFNSLEVSNELKKFNYGEKDRNLTYKIIMTKIRVIPRHKKKKRYLFFFSSRTREMNET